MQEAFGSPETPKNIIFGIRQLKKYFGHSSEPRKSSHSSVVVRFLYCLANFRRAACCLAVSRGFFCRLSGLQPLLFMNLQTMFFPPTRPLAANCCESCLVEFPLLYLAFFRTFLAASLRTLGLPVRFLSSKPSFFDDHFTTQRLFFSSFLAIPFTNKPVVLSINACDLR